jgi:hypothetical protein
VENGIIRMALIWFKSSLEDGVALSASRFGEFLEIVMVRGKSHGKPLQAAACQAIVEYQTDGRLQAWIDADDGTAFVRQLSFDVLTRGREVAFWGDKYPEYLFFARDLRRVFPNLRWLFIWREPASVIEGLSRKLGNPSRPVFDWLFSVEDCATRWVEWNRKWLELRRELDHQNFLEVKFDDLVADPAIELGRISEFIGFDLLGDRDAMALAGRLRPTQLNKWRKGKLAAEVEGQLARDDVREVYTELKGSA